MKWSNELDCTITCNNSMACILPFLKDLYYSLSIQTKIKVKISEREENRFTPTDVYVWNTLKGRKFNKTYNAIAKALEQYFYWIRK